MVSTQHQPGPPLSSFTIILSLLIACLLPVSLARADQGFVILPAIKLLLNGNTHVDATCGIDYSYNDEKYELVYRGLYYYQPEMSHTGYGLDQLSDSEFNRLSETDRRKVADNLLTALFFGYPAPTLEDKISSGSFLCSVRKGLFEKINDKKLIEKHQIWLQ